MTQDLTTLICLFHHQDQAQAALEDILKAGIPEPNVTLIGGPGSNISANRASLAELNVPERDIDHLVEGLGHQGAIVSVSAISDLAEKVEAIFADHKAAKIDEAVVDDDMSDRALPAALPLAAAALPDQEQRVIPIVDEDLQVGKRTVDAGGVRIFKRIVEIPVEESVLLREEHVSVDRHAVNRAVTDADLALQGEHTIELTETAEEVVIAKSARVVEEIYVGKEAASHVETIRDTVRHTEVEVVELEPEASSLDSDRNL